MRATERGFLLLTSSFGDPARRPLTVAQFRTLAKRMQTTEKPKEQRDLTVADIQALGYDAAFASKVLHLLSQEDVLEHYMSRGQRNGCVPVTRVSEDYPAVLRMKLGMDSPASLWAQGDLSLLKKPMIALVGSRDIEEKNRDFAWEVGTQAAKQGYVLVSGNARGADRIAQTACRKAGGELVVVVADALEKQTHQEGVLYLSEEGYDLEFSAQRALSRNRVIHALAQKTFVAQCTLGMGGTWDGTTKNLKNCWSPVFCFDDGSEAMAQLSQMGAQPIAYEHLKKLGQLQPADLNLFDQ